MAIHQNRVRLDELRSRAEELKAAASSHHAQNLRVTGSIARGEDDDNSDVDILVDLDPDRRLKGFAYFAELDDLRRHLERLIGRRVDVIDALSLQPHPNELRTRAMFRELVLRDAVPL